MSDSESSDGMDELQDLIAEYEAKANDGKKENTNAEQVKVEKNPFANDGEVPMDKVIFGDKKGLIRNLAKAVGVKTEDDIPDRQDDVSSDEDENENETNDGDQKRKGKKRKPAWVDADDDALNVGQVKRETRFTGPLDHLNNNKTYKDYLTARFTRIVAQPKWATQKERKQQTDASSDDEELLHSVGFLAKPEIGSLPSENIQCKLLKDLNRTTYSEAPITAIQFHPTSTAALVAGSSGVATIYSVDGTKNEKLHNMLFKKFPIKCAKIMPCGSKAIFGSIHKFYYSYDLLAAKEIRFFLPQGITTNHNFELSPCGRYMASGSQNGNLHLFHAASNELIHTYKLGEQPSGIRFTANSQRIICNARSSNVKIFSIRQQCLEHSFIDDGCISGRVLDLAPNQRLLATGSNEGVVNVYDFEKIQTTSTPVPEKVFLNLTTAITDVKFNHTSEMLAMCSKKAPGATKLAHFPTATVFADYPASNNKFGKVRIMEFSPHSGYLALGCLQKAVPLLRIKHFKNY